jgi:hypothetical protein
MLLNSLSSVASEKEKPKCDAKKAWNAQKIKKYWHSDTAFGVLNNLHHLIFAFA